MAKKDSDGCWINPQGKPVPTAYIKQYDKKRDSMVEKTSDMMDTLLKRIAITKGRIIELFDKFLEESERLNDVQIGGGKGNVSITNFSGNLKIERCVSEIHEFDERRNQGIALIQKCIEKWSEDVKGPIKAIVNQLFDERTGIDWKSYIKLKSYKIDDKDWKKAMDILSEAERVIGTKTYFRIYKRDNIEDKWRYRSSDISKIEPIFSEKRTR